MEALSEDLWERELAGFGRLMSHTETIGVACACGLPYCLLGHRLHLLLYTYCGPCIVAFGDCACCVRLFVYVQIDKRS